MEFCHIPLDPTEGKRYTEPLHAKDEIDQIYKLNLCKEDQINPNVYGNFKWEKDSSCFSNSNEELENWQNRLHEVSVLHCNRVTCALHCITSEVHYFPHYDGTTDVNPFLGELERSVLIEQRFHTLDLGLHTTPARWWETHKENMGYWEECTQMTWLRFEQLVIKEEDLYSGKEDPRRHLAKWNQVWGV